MGRATRLGSANTLGPNHRGYSMGLLNGPNPQGAEESMEALIRYNTLG